MEPGRRYGGVIWPVILIGAGIVFLLNNTGVLPWSVWGTLLRLWPVLLVAVGLDILIGRRSVWGSALVAVLMVAVFAAAILLGGPQRTVAGLVERTEQISEPVNGATQADVTVSFGSGNLVLGALPAGSDKLIEGSVDLSRNERLEKDRSGTGGNARYSLKSNDGWTSGVEVLDRAEDKVWELDLNGDLPLTLRLDSGVGKSTLNLSDLSLSRLDLNGGVGQVNLRLPGRGVYSVDIDGGVGELIVILPQELGARVTIDGGLGGVDVKGDFQRSERVYTTPGYTSAQDRAEIKLQGGLGRIEVRRATE